MYKKGDIIDTNLSRLDFCSDLYSGFGDFDDCYDFHEIDELDKLDDKTVGGVA